MVSMVLLRASAVRCAPASEPRLRLRRRCATDKVATGAVVHVLLDVSFAEDKPEPGPSSYSASVRAMLSRDITVAAHHHLRAWYSKLWSSGA